MLNGKEIKNLRINVSEIRSQVGGEISELAYHRYAKIRCATHTHDKKVVKLKGFSTFLRFYLM
jgi:hypothetical protein